MRTGLIFIAETLGKSARQGLDVKKLLLILSLFFFFPLLSQAAVRHNILILHSYHQGYPWNDDIQRGILDNLPLDQQHYSVYLEYLDTLRHPSPQHLDLMAKILREKYQKNRVKLDLILASDDNALSFLHNRAELFADIPLVFCGINDYEKKNFPRLKNFTGVNESISVEETVSAALKMRPRAKKLAVISDTTPTGERNLRIFEQAASQFAERISIIYLSRLEPEELSQKISALSREDILLYLSYLTTPSGKTLSVSESIDFIKQSSPAPVFGFWDFLLPHGIAGGKMVHGYSQGEAAAKLALRILSGTSVASMPVRMESPNKYIWNGKVLEEYNIASSTLPANSQIKHRSVRSLLPDWEKIRYSSFFSFESFDRHGNLMWFVDPESGTILDANQAALDFYGYNKLIGKSIYEINTLPKDRIDEIIREALTHKKNRFDFQYKTASGRLKNIESYIYPVTIQGIPLLFSIMHDVTEKHVSQKNLAKRNQMLLFSGFIIVMLLAFFLTLLFLQNKKLRSVLHDVTLQQKKWKNYVDIAPMGIFVADAQGKYLEVNQTACRLTGYSEEELLTMTIEDLKAPADRQAGMLHFEKLKAEGFAEGEFCYLHKDGSQRYFALRASRISPDRFLGIANDVTDKKRSEAALRNSETQYRLLFESMQEGFALHKIITNPAGEAVDYRFITVNPAFERLTGLKSAELIGKRVKDVLPATEDYWIKTYAAVAISGKHLEFENYSRELDKYYRVVAFSPQPGYFATIFEDTTHRKKAEKALMDSEKLLNDVQKLSKTGGWEWDIKEQSMKWTRELYHIHDMDPSLLEPGSPEHIKQSLACYGSENQRIVAEAFELCFREGVPYDLEVPFTTVKGAKKWVRTLGEAVWENDAIVKARGNLMDITERKLGEIALQESEQRFQQLFEEAPLGYQSLDEKGCFIEVNQAWLETLGYAKKEVLGHWFGEFLDAKDQEIFLTNFPLFKERGRTQVVFNMRHKDGTLKTISFEGRISYAPNGRFNKTHCIINDITAQKAAETALMESEARFKALHNASFGGIVIHDQGVILECNQGLSEMTGYAYSELIGMDGLLLLAEISRKMVREKIASGYEKPYEAFGLRKNGEIYPVRLEARNIPYRGKNVRSVEFRDISEQKKLENTLRENQEELFQIFDNVPMTLMLVNQERRVVKINRTGLQKIGKTASEVLGFRGGEVFNCLHSFNDKGGCGFKKECEDCVIKNAVMQTFQTKKGVQRRSMGLWIKSAAAKEKIYLEISTTYIDKPAAPLVLVILDDVSAQKLYLNEIKESRERLKAIFEQANDAIMLMDTMTLRFVDFNDVSFQCLGYTREEFLNLSFLDLLPRKDDQKPHSKINIILSQGRHIFESEIRKKTGEIRDFLISSRKITLSKKDYVLTIATDITERKKIERALYDKEIDIRVAQETSRAKDEFMSSVTHELKTPLTGMIGLAETLLRMQQKNVLEKEKLGKITQGIIQSGEHLSLLIDDILDYSRLEAGEMKLESESVSVKEILGNYSEQFLDEAAKKGLKLLLPRLKKDIFLFCDRRRFIQIYYNLLSNALKFTEAGQISVRLKTSAEMAVIDVKDTGPGIHDKVLERLFERFFRVESSGNKPGTGLGLPISRQLARLMGGDLVVASTPGKGSTFTLTLPLSLSPGSEK